MKTESKFKKINKKSSENLNQNNSRQNRSPNKSGSRKNLKENILLPKSTKKKFSELISYYQQKKRLASNSKRNRVRITRNSKKNLFVFQRTNLIGRPYADYGFLLSKNYLSFSLVVRPNNVFGIVKGISFDQHPVLKQEVKKESIIKQKKSSDYNIKFTNRGVKSKVLTFLAKFISSFKYLKVKKYSFIVLTITTPKSIRKKVINLITKSFLAKRCKYKKVIFNIKHQKVFNGCSPRKQIRKKRRKSRLFK